MAVSLEEAGMALEPRASKHSTASGAQTGFVFGLGLGFSSLFAADLLDSAGGVSASASARAKASALPNIHARAFTVFVISGERASTGGGGTST